MGVAGEEGGEVGGSKDFSERDVSHRYYRRKWQQRLPLRFVEDHFAVAFARVGEHHPQHVRSPALPIRADHRCASAEVDL